MASSMDAMRFPVADEFTISSAKLRRRTLTSEWTMGCLKSCWLQFEDCVFKGKIFACLSVRRIASESLRNVRTYLRMSSIVFLQLMNCSKCLHTRFCLAIASFACTRTILLSSSTSACTNQRLSVSECYAIIREHRKNFRVTSHRYEPGLWRLHPYSLRTALDLSVQEFRWR
jgi:hypothetical protein